MSEASAPTKGENIKPAGMILGAQYVRDVEAFVEENRKRYERSPVIAADDIPRGHRCHVGNGVWLARCRECDDYALTYGTAWCYEFGMHEYEHGLDVVGITIGMLPH